MKKIILSIFIMMDWQISHMPNKDTKIQSSRASIRTRVFAVLAKTIIWSTAVSVISPEYPCFIVRIWSTGNR